MKSITFNSNSLPARAIRLFLNPLPSDICDLTHKLILLLFFLPFVMIDKIWGGLFGGPWRGVSVILRALRGFGLFILVLCLSVVGYEYTKKWYPELSTWANLGLGLILVILIVIIGFSLLALCLYTGVKIDDMRKARKEHTPKPNEPSIIVNIFRSIKEKTCFKIDWTDPK